MRALPQGQGPIPRPALISGRLPRLPGAIDPSASDLPGGAFRHAAIKAKVDLMTDTERNALIAELIDRDTAANTASRAIARKTLISEGIYTAKGELRVEYGGVRKKAQPTG